jgi:hypothetical protein
MESPEGEVVEELGPEPPERCSVRGCDGHRLDDWHPFKARVSSDVFWRFTYGSGNVSREIELNELPLLGIRVPAEYESARPQPPVNTEDLLS